MLFVHDTIKATENSIFPAGDWSLNLRRILVYVFSNQITHFVLALNAKFVYRASYALAIIQVDIQGSHDLHRWTSGQGS